MYMLSLSNLYYGTSGMNILANEMNPTYINVNTTVYAHSADEY